MTEPDPRQTARELLVEAHPSLVGLSHWIHANPELGYQETLAAGWVAEWMQSAGFDVRVGVAGMDTAIVATSGTGTLPRRTVCRVRRAAGHRARLRA